ncbi:MAG: hypothetical protein ACOVQH_01170 [Burkholderiaceae bacterium]
MAILPQRSVKGKPEIHEKRLRPIAAMLSWKEQRAAWKQICDAIGFQYHIMEESVDQV